MALQTSGAISLNDMHVEVGGTSGTTVSLNDTDIRGLINKASGATMSFNEWYGASASLGTFTVTKGNQSTPYAGASGYSTTTGVTAGSFGSISPYTFTDSQGATRSVEGFYRVSATGSYYGLDLQLSGSSSLGFTDLIVDLNGTTYTLSKASAYGTYNSTYNHYRFSWNTNSNFFVYGTQANTDLMAEFPHNGTGTVSFELV